MSETNLKVGFIGSFKKDFRRSVDFLLEKSFKIILKNLRSYNENFYFFPKKLN